jgi:branched-chain amino acid transport system ATP-binding protein
MGLAPIIVEEIFRIIKAVNQTGTTILLVEQNAFMALDVANKAYVLETGKIVISGSAKTLLDDPEVSRAYLGIEPTLDSIGT